MKGSLVQQGLPKGHRTLEGRVVFKSLFFKEMVFQVADLKICPKSLVSGLLSACALLNIYMGVNL